jgi:hypothetical protein
MACQPAVYVGVLFFVAFDTFPHAPIFGRQPMKVFHLSMAFPAGNFTVDMALMVEQNMLGYIVYFHPGGGSLGVEVFMLPLNPGMFFDDIIMAVQTFFHRRNARKV